MFADNTNHEEQIVTQQAASGKFESERLCSEKRRSMSRDVSCVYFCSILFGRLLSCEPSNSSFLMMPYPP
jgi:hypothetical protein